MGQSLASLPARLDPVRRAFSEGACIARTGQAGSVRETIRETSQEERKAEAANRLPAVLWRDAGDRTLRRGSEGDFKCLRPSGRQAGDCFWLGGFFFYRQRVFWQSQSTRWTSRYMTGTCWRNREAYC